MISDTQAERVEHGKLGREGEWPQASPGESLFPPPEAASFARDQSNMRLIFLFYGKHNQISCMQLIKIKKA